MKILVVEEGVDRPIQSFLKTMGYEVDHVDHMITLTQRIADGDTFDGIVIDDYEPLALVGVGIAQVRKYLPDAPVFVLTRSKTKPQVENAGGIYCDYNPATLAVSLDRITRQLPLPFAQY